LLDVWQEHNFEANYSGDMRGGIVPKGPNSHPLYMFSMSITAHNQNLEVDEVCSVELHIIHAEGCIPHTLAIMN
jgi:hypothetical protein